MNAGKNKYSPLVVGMRNKLLSAFCLMSVIPLLVMVYILTVYFQDHEMIVPVIIGTIVFFAAVISVLGFFLARAVIGSVSDLAIQAKLLAVEDQTHAVKDDISFMKDKLTGLYNKEYLITRLDEEIERSIRCQRPCSLIIIDLDNFREYTLEHGQLVSETALVKVTGVIRKAITGPLDRPGRISDGEFAIIMPEKSKRSAITMAEKLNDGIHKAFESEKDSCALTATTGVSENPLDGSSAKELVNNARETIKRTKAARKNGPAA